MRIKRLMATVLLLCASLLVVVEAQEIAVPQLEGRMADYAAIISPSKLHLLHQISSQHEFITKERIALVTIESSGEMSPQQYAEQLHRTWLNEQRGRGVLLVLYKVQRSGAIAVGDELRGRLSKAKVEAILAGDVTTNMEAGTFDEAAMNGIKAVLGHLAEGR